VLLAGMLSADSFVGFFSRKVNKHLLIRIYLLFKHIISHS